MPTEAVPKLTLKEKVDVLREHGVDAYGWTEPRTSEFFPIPIVFFRGDENEGHRALKIMQAHGVYVWQLERHWHYEGHEDALREQWAILF